MADIPTLKLNDGCSIPLLAYGTGTAWSKSSTDAPIAQSLIDATKTAIKIGYTHLDGAEVYNNESELGVAIKQCGVPREQLYVVTKVHQGMSDIPSAFAASLKRLQVEYVDLYLIHQPFFAKTPGDLQNAWKAMEEIKRSGKAKSIGVSNYQISDLESTLETAQIPPAINQIEYHPYLQQTELVEFHRSHGIALAAYGPLTAVTKARPGPADGVLATLANKYGVSEGEVALRWVIDQGIIAVTTSSKEGRLQEYLGVTRFKLTEGEVLEIAKVGEGKKFRGFWQTKF